MDLIVDLKTRDIILITADRDPLTLQPIRMMPRVFRFTIRSTISSMYHFSNNKYEMEGVVIMGYTSKK